MSSSAKAARPVWQRNLLTTSWIVVIVLGVCGVGTSVAAIGLARTPRGASAQRVETKMTLLTVQQALVSYQADHTEDCPASIDALVEIKKQLGVSPRDAWGQPLQFVCPGVHTTDGADVVSAGPDKQFDTQDDIKSWEL